MYQYYDYPHASNIKSKLYETIKNNLHHPVRGGAYITPFNLYDTGIREIDIVTQWIHNLIPQISYKFSQGGEDHSSSASFNTYGFSLKELWGIYYKKGESIVKHNHFPWCMSFCYYVNVPRKWVPLIVEGKRIKPVEGRFIIFLSHQYHWIPPAKEDGRCVLTGNLRTNL